MRAVLACLCLWIALASAGCGTYVGSDGSKYNLDPLTKSVDYTGKETAAAYTYFYNFCQNIDKAKTGTTCTNPTPVAQISNSGQCTAVGYLPPVISDLPNGGGVKIVYTNNADLCGNPKTIPRVSTFTLTCSPNTEYDLVRIDEPGTCQYAFTVNTKYACPGGANPSGGDKGGMSGGSIFLIIFFCGLAAYFLIGMVVKWRAYNASGVELIPNTDLWIGLPGLIRDGFLFVKNKLTGAVGYSSL